MDGQSTTAKDTTLVTTRITLAMAAELSRRAEEADRSLSAEIRRAVRLYLKEEEAAA